MIEIKNNRVLDWVKECADLTNQKEIVWIDGSEEQLEHQKRGLRYRRND